MKNTCKEKDVMKPVLGLTQSEIARLLGISVSHWSMYKSSKREISFASKIRLFSLMGEVKNVKEVPDATKSFLKTEEMKIQKQLKSELQTIKLKRYRIQKAIETLENQRKECLAALVAATVIENGFDGVDKALASSIQSRAKKMLDKRSMHKLEMTKLKLENLNLLEHQIIKRLKLGESDNWM